MPSPLNPNPFPLITIMGLIEEHYLKAFIVTREFEASTYGPAVSPNPGASPI